MIVIAVAPRSSAKVMLLPSGASSTVHSSRSRHSSTFGLGLPSRFTSSLLRISSSRIRYLRLDAVYHMPRSLQWRTSGPSPWKCTSTAMAPCHLVRRTRPFVFFKLPPGYQSRDGCAASIDRIPYYQRPLKSIKCLNSYKNMLV